MSVSVFPLRFLSLCLSVALSLTRSLCLSVCLSFPFSLSLSFSLSFILLSIFLFCVSVSVLSLRFLSLYVCLSVALSLSLSLSLALSLSHSLSLSLSQNWWLNLSQSCCSMVSTVLYFYHITMITYILYYLVFKTLSSFVRDSSYHDMYYKGCGLLCAHKKSFNTAIPVRSLGPYMYVHYCTYIVHILV